jgi:hypothetical protein
VTLIGILSCYLTRKAAICYIRALSVTLLTDPNGINGIESILISTLMETSDKLRRLQRGQANLPEATPAPWRGRWDPPLAPWARGRGRSSRCGPVPKMGSRIARTM